MASTVATLFGPSAEEIVYARKKDEEDAARQRYLARLQGAGQGLGPFAWAARAGVDIGESLRTVGSMFGDKIEDPLIKKSNRINKILIEENVDLNDPASLKRVAKRLEQEGYTNEAVRIYDRAQAIEVQNRTLAINEGKATQISRYYVDVDGQPVMENKNTGEFFTTEGVPIPPDEVIRAAEYDDYTTRALAVKRVRDIQEAKTAPERERRSAADPNQWNPVGVYKDGERMPGVIGGRTGLEAELNKRLEAEAAARAAAKANVQGIPDPYDDVQSDVQEIRRQEMLRMGGVTDPSYVPPNNLGRTEQTLLSPEQRYTFEQGMTPGMLFDPRRPSEADIVIPPWDIRYQNRF